MTDTEVCVLVAGVGGGGTGRELMKAFKMAKNRYKIVATDIWENSYGLYETPYRYLIPPAVSPNYIDSLLKICKKENVQAIVTGSEPELREVSKNKKIFDENGVKVLLNPSELIELCIDKLTLMNFLTSKGIKCPKNYTIEEESDFNKIESYPIIIKPRISSGSRNVFLAQDKQEAVFFKNYLLKYGFQPIIQEYIGTGDNEFTVGILYADNGKLLTSIAMKRSLGSGLSTREIITNSKTGEQFMISSGISQGLFDDFKEVREFSINIAKILNAQGPINVQCRKTEHGIIPFEINPRFSGTTGARSLIEHNEPDIFCRYRLFDEIPTKMNCKYGYVSRELVEKYISLEEAKKVPRV